MKRLARLLKKTLEIIYFDKREFRRENESEWKEIKRESSGGFGGGMGISGSEVNYLKSFFSSRASRFIKSPLISFR